MQKLALSKELFFPKWLRKSF